MPIQSRFTKDVQRRGSALLVTLLVMASLTVIGLVSISTSILEIQVGANDRQARAAFYLAESAVMEGIQRLAVLPREDLNEQRVFWHHPADRAGSGDLDFRRIASWDVDGQGEDNALACSLSPETFVAAVEWTVATGGSLIMSDARLYQNRIYGLCTADGVNQLVEIGHYMRY